MILPPATLGVLGSGQLGRYFVIAARELGYRVVVLDPDTHSAAGRVADVKLTAAYNDRNALNRMAVRCSAITTESENVPAETLAYLAQFVPVRPSAEAVAICQNRSMEKSFLKSHGFPLTPYADIHSDDDIKNVSDDLYPGILKLVRFGYDGKGQARVTDRKATRTAFQLFKGEPCVLEQQMALDYELSLVLTRDREGYVKCFPLAENRHRHGILDVSIAPARVPGRLRDAAEEVAVGIAAKLGYIGILCVEFFVSNGQLHVNEIAPRPHNSGHYTLDACVTSQFEQQVRALCDLPLGDTSGHSVAVMVNLLGDLWYPDGSHHPREPNWHKLLAVPNLKLHLYGKHHARPGRKMGHFTVLGNDPEKVRETAISSRASIGIRDE